MAELGVTERSPAPSLARGRRHEPITIVGAGPSGLACAIVLARSHRRVIVREWHDRVGARFHGDFQGLENWTQASDVLGELREARIEPTFKHHPISMGTAYDPRGEVHRIASRRPLFYLVRRGDDPGCLDHDLLQQAIAAGVDVRVNDRASHIEGPAILAGGPRRADAIAVGYVFETSMADGCWLALGNRLAPLGYSYLLVNDGRGTVATCMFAGFKQQAAYLERTVAFFRDRTGIEMRRPRPFGGFANFRLPKTAVQGGHLVVGEQAGFQDALAGFGMRYALRSGVLAARSLIDGSDYVAAWRRELLPLLRAGTVNRFVFNNIGEAGWRTTLKLLSRGDAGHSLQRLYQSSLLSRLIFPLARLRYRSALRDRSCDHVDCSCVWCQCQADAQAVSDRHASTPNAMPLHAELRHGHHY